jgi:adenosylmethionine-8-amino-7-oxononanoate aminotransferase
MLHDSPLWHPYTRLSAVREDGVPVIARGEGSWLIADDGTRFFDGTSSWWCANLGHNHPRVVEAIRVQAGLLDHSILGHLAHPGALALAQRLATAMPSPDRKTLFASDGSTAVESALKVAVACWRNRGRPEKSGFASLERPYHGDTVGAMSVGALPDFHAPYADLLFPVRTLPVPADEPAVADALRRAREVLAPAATRLAAVVVEPLVQGSAGMRIYPAAYLRGLADLCRELELLLIVDEIAMGFGRTGRRFAFEHAGIDPDLVCLGKGLSGGALPISALVARASIWADFSDSPAADRTFYHGHTYGGNPIACAAALAAWEVYQAEAIPERVDRLSALWRAAEPELLRLPGVRATRRLGFVWVVERSPDRAADAPALRRRCRDLGLLVRPLGEVVYLLPPLITPEAELGWAVDRLAEALRAEG